MHVGDIWWNQGLRGTLSTRLCSANRRYGMQWGVVSVSYGVIYVPNNLFNRAKYPLSITNALLQAFGSRIGISYDIGCKFGSTVLRSTLGPLAKELKLHMLVGAFHGHVHQWLCQLSYLTTYTQGLGLEDLEGCKHFFSKSNALTAGTQYSSVFHRQQSIIQYLQHTDAFETYPNLSMSTFQI